METNVQETKMEYQPLGISGLGGWLVLVQIGLYGTLLLAVVQLFVYAIPSYAADTWTTLTSKDSELYHVLWGPLIAFETVYNIVLIAFCLYILFQFYTKKRMLPRLMIILYAGSLLFGVIDYVLMLQIPVARELDDGSLMRDMVRSALTCLIWIPYFMRSERVQNTFVR